MNSIESALLNLKPGRYIVAVSGGVDSMALLHMLQKLSHIEAVAAHADHGMRVDSHMDMEIVKAFCMSHNIACHIQALHLSPDAGEDEARRARYAFLRQCLIDEQAAAILTAHHQDDLIETVIINILRGTGWRGLAPFVQDSDILRPLENVKKDSLVAYAARHQVPWRMDSTNNDQKYLRNYIRHTVVPYLDLTQAGWQRDLLRLIRKQQQVRRTIEDELDALGAAFFTVKGNQATCTRYSLSMLAPAEACELLQWVFRGLLGHSLVRRQVYDALLCAKVAKPHTTMPLNTGWHIRVTMRDFIVEPSLPMIK